MAVNTRETSTARLRMYRVLAMLAALSTLLVLLLAILLSAG